MLTEKAVYPFTAIVGQQRMKTALLLNVINPLLGGVLIRGEKGTAKSTAVRALADLMPSRRQVAGCRYACNPDMPDQLCRECGRKLRDDRPLEIVEGRMRVIDLPVSATEDRVVGTLDIEQAITKGEKRFEPGLLAQANRNILYVDEINLLDDHVVDILLDSAAMGVNVVEREGISYAHPARFTLVGTMNPEEGDLRPQLIDRFGLVVDIVGEADAVKRAEVVRRRLQFEQDPVKFKVAWAAEQEMLTGQIVKAAELLPHVTFSDEILEKTVAISIAFGVDGHRADIVMLKAAITLAAFEGRTAVTAEDLREAAAYVLPHRMRKRPFEDVRMTLDEMIAKISTLV